MEIILLIFWNYWWHDLSLNLQKEGKKAKPKLQKISPHSQKSNKIVWIEKINTFAPTHRKVNDMIKNKKGMIIVLSPVSE